MLLSIIAATYLTGWLASIVVRIRHVAAADGPNLCHGEGRDGSRFMSPDSCFAWHERGCWRPDTQRGFRGDDAVYASLLCLAWPVLALPVLAWWLAQRKPLPMTRRQLERYVAQLERENGMSN